jgi:hypothetical protein
VTTLPSAPEAPVTTMTFPCMMYSADLVDLVARMERSAIRDRINRAQNPGFRCAPSGLRSLMER